MFAGVTSAERGLYEMVKSLRVVLLLAALLLAAPSFALAKNKPAKSFVQGSVLYHAAVRGQTGNCYCEAQWYTVGLKPGKATVTLRLVSIAIKMGPAYSIRADLERRDRTILNQSSGACWRMATHCTLTVHFTAHVDKTAPYYIHVIGNGAEGMEYRLQVQGSQYLVK
jgi:hypothetical protein